MTNTRIYLLPPKGQLYKANLHCHSTVSDGKFSPAELKEMYKARGYHAIAYTDHRACIPHNELTDGSFVALTGMETAFGIKKNTSVHICGISRDPFKKESVADTPSDDLCHINEGIRRMNNENYITTLNHPRWSGMSYETIASVDNVKNMEIVNGFEMIQDGYGDSSACFELELRRGRKVFPIASDDSHTKSPSNGAGYEYFQGFTVLKAPELTYNSLIGALDSGSFFASTGPMIKELWIENNVLHVECSAVCGIYVHGNLYSHRAALISADDSIENADINVESICSTSSYVFVQIVDTNGKKAWSVPYWFDER